MDTLKTSWWKWCRLCAKNDSVNVIHIDYGGELNEAVGKYFDVQSSGEDLYPKYICQECAEFISSLLLYEKHVKHVQEMFTFLVANSADESCNLQAMRMKFNVRNANNGQWCSDVEAIISNSVLRQYINVKREDPRPEYVYEENNDITSNIEKFYDEVHLHSDSRNDDHSDTMPEDSIWGDDDETVDYESTQNDFSTNIDNFKAEESSDQTDTIRNPTFDDRTIKKLMVEDFVADVACTECEKTFTLYSEYCEHVEVMHKAASLRKNCPFCSRKQQTWYHLGKHMQRTHMPEESCYSLKCPECDCRYATSALLEDHLNSKHRNEKPYICEVCGFGAATKNSLTQHMFVHTDEAPYECEICKKRFKKRTRLNVHMDVHGPNKFVCTICGMQLNTRATLKKHFRVHSDIKRYKCDHCGSRFKAPKTLKDHLILHLGLTPYKCNFCDCTFSTRQPCRAHMMRAHPKEFSSMEAAGHVAYTENIPTLAKLKEAIKTTDNVIPIGFRGRPLVCNTNKQTNYKCHFCENKFNYRASRAKHMKDKHPTEFEAFKLSRSKSSINRVEKLRMRNLRPRAAKPTKPSEPITCEICRRSFAQRKLYESHVNKLHKAELAMTNNSSIPNADPISEGVDDENAVQSLENSTLSLDLHTGPLTTATKIHDTFFIIE